MHKSGSASVKQTGDCCRWFFRRNLSGRQMQIVDHAGTGCAAHLPVWHSCLASGILFVPDYLFAFEARARARRSLKGEKWERLAARPRCPKSRPANMAELDPAIAGGDDRSARGPRGRPRHRRDRRRRFIFRRLLNERTDGGFPTGFNYTSANNPNRAALEQALAALEGGAVAAAFASGVAAASRRSSRRSRLTIT